MSKDAETTIRPATVSDVKAIAVILRELGSFAHLNENPQALPKHVSPGTLSFVMPMKLIQPR